MGSRRKHVLVDTSVFIALEQERHENVELDDLRAFALVPARSFAEQCFETIARGRVIFFL